jgi:tRNA pseudouridine32 synthase/23S rRNA pseudouridine746 synthase
MDYYMSISPNASKVSLPQANPGVTTVLDYLVIKFPYINRDIWTQRMLEGKVHLYDGTLITANTPYKAQQRIFYYREITNELTIPFKEKIVFQNEHILVAYKPHFLAVTPGGKFINECLQNRLRLNTGIEHLQALHRLDRVTAGLVIFSVNKDTRSLYHKLFQTGKITKTYQAIANITTNKKLAGLDWEVKNRIEQKMEPKFLMQITEGLPNSHSKIKCTKQTTQQALFELQPITGKTHQLRLHMQSLGFPILNDKYYPELQPLSADNFKIPLQLLAKELSFIDPVMHIKRHFICDQELHLTQQ